MRYMLLFAGTDEAWNQMSEDQRRAMYARIGEWWRGHTEAGRIVGGEQLAPASSATTIRVRPNGDALVTDGPFLESKEIFGGFAIIEAADLDEAIELAKSWPAGETIEVRPVVEMNMTEGAEAMAGAGPSGARR